MTTHKFFLFLTSTTGKVDPPKDVEIVRHRSKPSTMIRVNWRHSCNVNRLTEFEVTYMYVQSCSAYSVEQQLETNMRNVTTLPYPNDCVDIATPYLHPGTTHIAFVTAKSGQNSAISNIASLYIRKFVQIFSGKLVHVLFTGISFYSSRH